MEWDKGPPNAIKTILEDAPIDEYKSLPSRFRLEWGPMFYRGRLNGSAKVLVIGQDPAADENIAHRIFVGTAGQRVQGFLSKIGITKSYVMVNSFLYSIRGQFDNQLRYFNNRQKVKSWRNKLLDALKTSNLEAIIAFGNAAKNVVNSWPGASSFSQSRKFFLMHPTARYIPSIFSNWNYNLSRIANKVTPDSGSNVDLTPYSGTRFKSSYLSRIPLRDFGFGVPQWMGNGNMAIRVGRRCNSMPYSVKNNPTIYWVAIEDEG